MYILQILQLQLARKFVSNANAKFRLRTPIANLAVQRPRTLTGVGANQEVFNKVPVAEFTEEEHEDDDADAPVDEVQDLEDNVVDV